MTISQHHSRQNHDLTDKMLLDNDMGFPQCGDSNAWRRRYLLFRGVMRIDRLRVQSYLDTSLKSYPFIYGILKKKKNPLRSFSREIIGHIAEKLEYGFILLTSMCV